MVGAFFINENYSVYLTHHALARRHAGFELAILRSHEYPPDCP